MLLIPYLLIIFYSVSSLLIIEQVWFNCALSPLDKVSLAHDVAGFSQNYYSTTNYLFFFYIIYIVMFVMFLLSRQRS